MKTLPRLCRELSHVHAATIRNPNRPIQISVFPFSCHFIFPRADWPAWWLLCSLSPSSPLCPSLCRPRGSQEGWSLACWLWEPQRASRKEKKRTRSWDCDQILGHPVSKKGHEETCGMYDMTIKGLLAFFPFNCLPESFSHPFFFLLSSHGEHLSWRREDPRQVTCKRGQSQRAQCHAFSISFKVPLTLPLKWAHFIQLPQ